jgi:DNA-binding NtrC family response regulator
VTATADRRPRWPALFHDSSRPLFVLFRTRRIRFVNAAWEAVTGRSAEGALGRACVRTGPTEPLFRTLAPPAEAVAGKVTTVRRPVPPHKAGPPWWDITFVPLTSADGSAGFLGLIDVTPTAVGEKARSLPAVIASVRTKHAAHFTPELFAGDTPEAERLLAQIRLAASTTVPLWIVGEAGVGKETLARVVHHTGPTKERTFVAVDGGVQPYLTESLFFGHGGLAGANRVGTVYLKSPAALPRDLQQRFADWVSRTPAPRLICGAIRTADEEVRSSGLLPVFHTALSVLELRPPPLRTRLPDLARFAERIVGSPVSADMLAVLTAHHWPGNLRELADVLAAAQEKANGTPLTPDHLPRYVRERALTAATVPQPAPSPTLDAVLEAVERNLIALALKRAGGNQTEAAAKLGVFRTRLGRRIEALGIDVGRSP